MVSWSEGSSSSSDGESVTSQAEQKCNFLKWIDPEWSVAMQFCIAELWSMYDKENEDGIRDNLKIGEENFRVIAEKRKMEEEIRCFRLDFAKMVVDKEEAVNQLGNARLALSDLKEEIEKKKLADHGCTNLHQKHGYEDKIKKLKEICDEL
ncbi:putative CBL-interacting protein kinase 13 [Hordeum vulgare]|nr:putative CBL-interacting protein kinase 13 [Hordeum vulgare]